MTASSEGKVALVTGAGGDVGGAACVLFAESGAAVVAVDRNAAGLAALRSRLPRDARLLTITADVTDEAEVAGYVAAARELFGGVDLFFNNAGVEGSRTGAWRLIPDLSIADFEEILAVNATGVFLGLKHVLPMIAERGGGAIVNASSNNGLKGARGQVAYAASKHAVAAMTVTAAKEGAALGVRVNAIAPGAIQGRMLRDFVPILVENMPPRREGETPRHNPPPIERWSDPSEIAALAVFLCSVEASYMTGGVYSVDGGLIAL